jgi:cytochrome b6-f complex iron-sulfur subunit
MGESDLDHDATQGEAPAGDNPSLAQTDSPAVDPRRRGILRAMFGSCLGAGFTALGAAAGLWAAGTARFLMPNVTTEPPNRFKVGFPSDYPAGRVETRYKETYGVWVVHGVYQGRAQIYALRTTCTHLGCITIWQESEEKFKCPCHGSGFYRDGLNFEGPAPRPLERCAIRIADDGQLEVDRSRVFQQELGQWDDAACYVPV